MRYANRTVAFAAVVLAVFVMTTANYATGAAGANSEKTSNEDSSTLCLLDLIRNNADSVEYFSLPLFLTIYEAGDLDNDLNFHRLSLEKVVYPITYDRFCKGEFLFEAALHANRVEIVDCLEAFNDLSLKEKTFVLEACTLYVLRSDLSKSTDVAEEAPNVEPLSEEEKSLFRRLVLDCSKDAGVVFPALEATWKEWETSFRKGALEFQKVLGDKNPFYPYSADTDEMWQSVCNEAPIAILYSILIGEARPDVRSMILSTQNDDWGSMVREPLKEGSFENVDDSICRETVRMQRFLFLNTSIGTRDPNLGPNWGTAPKPVGVEKTCDVRMSDVATQILDRFPEMKE